MRNIIELYARNPTAPSDIHFHMFFNANKYVPVERPLHQSFEYIFEGQLKDSLAIFLLKKIHFV